MTDRVLFKPLDEQYSAVECAIRELHSYELLTIHAFGMAHVAPDYGTWIEDSIAAQGPFGYRP